MPDWVKLTCPECKGEFAVIDGEGATYCPFCGFEDVEDEDDESFEGHFERDGVITVRPVKPPADPRLRWSMAQHLVSALNEYDGPDPWENVIFAAARPWTVSGYVKAAPAAVMLKDGSRIIFVDKEGWVVML